MKHRCPVTLHPGIHSYYPKELHDWVLSYTHNKTNSKLLALEKIPQSCPSTTSTT